MAAATTVHLVRHAAHDRVDHVLCGCMPGVVLGAGGKGQAAALAEAFAAEAVAAVVTSPLERARETAGPIAASLRLPVEIAPGWREIDFGEWTGKTFEDLAADPRWSAWNTAREAGRPPGGEPMRAVQARALAEIEHHRAAHPGGAVVAVSHCDVVKAVVCGTLGLSLDRYDTFDIAPASITTLVLWAGGGKVIRLNETSHLKPQTEAVLPSRKAAA